jgi:hypothetical protein
MLRRDGWHSSKRDLILIGVLGMALGACACWERASDGSRISTDRRLRAEPVRADARGGDGHRGLVRSAGNPGEVDVTFTVHGRRDVRPISPYVYGVNVDCPWEEQISRPGMVRLGGNRWTAYNWHNNASNAGLDYHHQNDGWLRGGDRPGEAVRSRVSRAHELGAATIVTIPITDWVAADKAADGDVRESGEHYLQTRFRPSRPRKPEPFAYPPPLEADAVYQDEFIHWLEGQCDHGESGPPIFYALDNEPGIWSTTHARIRPEPVTYAEMIERTIEYARAIKDVSPRALIFGPVSYGWLDFTTLQNAPDARGRDFLDVYLSALREASEAEGRRLLDVLTVHWYPEARGGGERVNGQGTDPEVVEARVQAPRSLWDPRYTEDSWITRRALWGPIRLLPRLQGRINAFYPGTRLAITEYNYGGGGHISGGVAQADVLGIFGREGLFAASVWTFGQGPADFIYAAMNMYLDFDGEGSGFGDRSVYARTEDHVTTSVYASLDSADAGRMVVVAINKTDAPKTAGIRITHDRLYERARVFRLTAAAARPVADGEVEPVADNAFRVTLPPMSVTTLELTAF